jgi:rhomboid-like protein
MYAMQSFLRASSWYIGSTQSLDPNFRGFADSEIFTLTDPSVTYTILAFFLTAGVFSTFGSHASHAIRLMHTRRRTSDIEALSKARRAIRPSLGASGAVYGTVVVTALAMPDTPIQLLFMPFLAAPIRWGAAGLVAMDTVGIIRGWRVLDHYAHLSGAAFGGAYFFGGPWLWAGTAKLMSSKKPSSRD